MLTKNNIKKFENELLSIGDELTYRSARNQKIESVLATPKDAVKTEPDPSAPSLEDFLNQSALEKEQLAKEQTISREDKSEQEKNTLGDIFDGVLEEEGISIDDIDPVPAQFTDEEDIDEEDAVNEVADDEPIDETADATDEVADDVTDTIDEVADDTTDEVADDDTDTDATADEAPLQDIEALLEDSSPDEIPKEADDNDAQIEEIFDDIDDIENVEEVFEEDDSEFVLPSAFLKNEVSDGKEEKVVVIEEEESEPEEDINLEDLFGGSDSLFDDESSDDFDGDDESRLYSTTGESIEREPEKYRSDRDFVKEDEVLFFDRIDQYNIYLTQAIIEILENDEYVDDVERVVDLILDNANPHVIHHEVERILKREINLFKDNNIYDILEITGHFNNLSEKVKETTNFFITKIVPVCSSSSDYSVLFFFLCV